MGVKAGLKIVDEAGQLRLADAVAAYLAEIQLTKKPKTLAAYTTALDYFMESCKKRYVIDIERRDLLEFAAFLRDDKEQAPRSCWNKFANVMQRARLGPRHGGSVTRQNRNWTLQQSFAFKLATRGIDKS